MMARALSTAALAAVVLAGGCRREGADYPTSLAAARQLFDERQYEKALPLFDQLRRRYPDEAEPYVYLARTAARLGRAADAIPALEERVGRGGAGAHLYHFLLGGLLAAADRRGDAESQFREALRIDPGYSPAYLQLSRLLVRTARVKEGIELAASGLARFPDDTRLRTWYAGELMQRGRWAEAERALAPALAAANPGGARYVLGLIYLNTGRLAEARRELEAATELEPNGHRGWYQLANVCERLGDLPARDGALARFRAVYRPLEMAPE